MINFVTDIHNIRHSSAASRGSVSFVASNATHKSLVLWASDASGWSSTYGHISTRAMWASELVRRR